MRKIIALLMVCIMCFAFTACKGNGDATSASSDITASTNDVSSESTNTEETPSEDTLLEDISSEQLTSSVLSEPEEEEIKYIPDTNDKAYSDDPGSLMNPMTSKFDAQADTLRSSILDAKDKNSYTGQVWYISNKGSDKNSGKSPDEAWASINALNYLGGDIKAGDSVLFERGGVYRGTFVTVNGVYYGAYGSGDKPCIYASEQNFAKATWVVKHGNIWRLEYTFSTDVGEIVMNHGESVGYKKTEKYEMKQNGDFWCDAESGYVLYMYSDKNPTKKYKSIEIGEAKNIIRIPSGSQNITVENLCLKYTGAHAVAADDGVKNITVRNCEIGFIGGSYLKGFWRENTRYGNGIEFMYGCENILVENNWIYQIYDSGITHQGGGDYAAKNVTFRKNLIEYCGMGSIEYWLAYSEENYNYAENVTYADNIMRFAGYGFGGIQRPDKNYIAHIQSDYENQNHFVNFNITGNIFDQSSYDLIEITSLDATYPIFSGNIYAQKIDGRLGKYADNSDLIFNSGVNEIINTVIGDKTAQIIFY